MLLDFSSNVSECFDANFEANGVDEADDIEILLIILIFLSVLKADIA
jgi:hypothetical protein